MDVRGIERIAVVDFDVSLKLNRQPCVYISRCDGILGAGARPQNAGFSHHAHIQTQHVCAAAPFIAPGAPRQRDAGDCRFFAVPVYAGTTTSKALLTNSIHAVYL